MSKNVLQGKWDELRGEVKEQWGKLTDDDIKRVKGKRDRLEGALQEKYGYTKQKARQEVDDFLSEFSAQLEQTRSKVQESVEDVRDSLAESRKKAGKVARRKAEAYNERLEESMANMPGNPVEVVNQYPMLVMAMVLIAGVIIGLLLRPPGSR